MPANSDAAPDTVTLNSKSRPSGPGFVDFFGQLDLRDRLLRLLRKYFHENGFREVQPPCLSRDCVVDAYLDPIVIPGTELGMPQSTSESTPPQYYLQTSAESAMKRLLAQGAPSIFAISPVFRRGEVGVRHNVEFTMLEWYEVGGDATSAIELLGNLAALIFETSRFDTVSYRDAFTEHLSIDPIEAPIEQVSKLVGGIDAELAISIGSDRDSLLDVLLSHFVEPQLGKAVPTILTRYPVTQAALARPCEDDPRFAHRFELFYRGIELANGYDELLDADELVRRYQLNNEIRCQTGRQPLAVDTTLVAAMRRGLPACSGVAVGVDRLQMLLSGARSIDEVIPLPITIA
ncbi:EF-P lysine aminoacylase EpmA [Allorhodopirellula heiligendammensis]|uniref:Elongation factor P--(R)-beta-lysine ligase n=1 Tax=Allorhodopirellula heiligendammensis TaxID=2714739 RepID=A0A5C6BTP5_9BACT|nr:EF-P lysine aminoacylase EpmA [Allorhodopirellula heiligendammensis]TWU15395.1 Elongation factor P--(R)-beta-lysine ligase [Allorhodopirellula heiligendammensis]